MSPRSARLKSQPKEPRKLRNQNVDDQLRYNGHKYLISMNNNNNKFLIGLSLSIAAGIIYFKWIRRPKPSIQQSQHESHIGQQETVFTASYEDQHFDKQAQITNAVQSIELSDEQYLNFEDIKQIYLHSLDIIKEEYFRHTKQVRRRLIRKINQEQYLNIIIDYQNQVSELLERGRIELAEALQVQQDLYLESIYQIQHGEFRQQFIALEESASQKLKQKIIRKRRLSDATAIEILQFQLSFLKAGLYLGYQEKLKKKNVEQVQIVNAIQAVLQDLIYQKFGYEEQHMIMKLSDNRFANLPEIKFLTHSIQEENQKLLGKLAGFKTNYETIEYDDDDDQ